MASGPMRLLWVGCAACVIGCGAGAPAPVVHSFTPLRGYTDRPLRFFIRGDGFIPTFQIDTTSGERLGQVSLFAGTVGTAPRLSRLQDFDWLDISAVSASLEPGLEAGEHPLKIRDPRGGEGAAPMRFSSLGPDRDKPTVAFTRPAAGAPVAAGMTIDLAIEASDREPGQLESLGYQVLFGDSEMQKMHACPLTADLGAGRCDVRVVVPTSLAPGDTFQVRAVAVDRAIPANRSETTLSLVVQAAPTITGVNPARGGIVGGTDLVIRGTGFLPGTKVFVGKELLLPDGGLLVSPDRISGRAPEHKEGEGVVTITVRTPIGDTVLPDGFRYERPPMIESIIPEVGLPDGGTTVRVRGTGFTTATLVYFGDSLVGAEPFEVQRFVSDTEIVGEAPAGKGSTSVWAFDPAVGWSRLVDGFAWSLP